MIGHFRAFVSFVVRSVNLTRCAPRYARWLWLDMVLVYEHVPANLSCECSDRAQTVKHKDVVGMEAEIAPITSHATLYSDCPL